MYSGYSGVFIPKAPPTSSVITTTFSSAMPNVAATSSRSATAPCVPQRSV